MEFQSPHLKKKHHSIAYHRSREAVEAGTVRTDKEASKRNLADAFTKLMTAVKRTGSFDMFMYTASGQDYGGDVPAIPQPRCSWEH
jgi:hypothetical protein